MGDLVRFLLVLSFIISFVLAGVAAFVLLLNFLISFLFVTVNQNVFADLFALVSIWLPFDLAAIYIWLTAAAYAFLMYRLALVAYTWLNRFLQKS